MSRLAQNVFSWCRVSKSQNAAEENTNLCEELNWLLDEDNEENKDMSNARDNNTNKVVNLDMY